MKEILSAFQPPTIEAWATAASEGNKVALTAAVRGGLSISIWRRGEKGISPMNTGRPVAQALEYAVHSKEPKVRFFELKEESARAWKKKPGLFVEFDCAPIAARGAAPAQEVAYAVGGGIAWLRSCAEDPELLQAPLSFQFVVSPDFVLEVAKCRAFWRIWEFVLEQLEAGEVLPRTRTVGRLERWIEKARSPLELSRLTAAGAAALCAPYDLLVLDTPQLGRDVSPETAQRLAGNVVRILQEEARIGEVKDPMAGSGHVEEFTEVIAESAWKYVQQIESDGGIFKSTSFERAVAEEEKRAEESLAQGDEIVVEVNYMNPETAGEA